MSLAVAIGDRDLALFIQIIHLRTKKAAAMCRKANKLGIKKAPPNVEMQSSYIIKYSLPLENGR